MTALWKQAVKNSNFFAKIEAEHNRLIQNPDIYKKGNQLNRLQNEHYAYDNAGRLIAKTQIRDGFRKQETTYRWNSHNQLTGLTNLRGKRGIINTMAWDAESANNALKSRLILSIFGMVTNLPTR